MSSRLASSLPDRSLPRGWFAGALAGVALLLVPGLGQASVHLMKIHEFFPGTAGQPNAQYVMLKMCLSGQRFTDTTAIRVFNDSNMEIGTFTFTADLADGANQATALIATPEAETLFVVTADLAMAAGIPLSGGKICFDDTPGFGVIDCVSWGSFPAGASGTGVNGNTGTPYRVGIGLTQGQAVRRDFSGGAPTQLDCSDDTGNSVADFECSDAEPVPNSGIAGTPLAASPACPVCGNNTTEPGEECDGTDDTACPLLCEVDCTCPAPPQTLLGKLLSVKDPLPGGGGDPTKRKFIVKAKESDSVNTPEGDPFTNPSTLEITLAGTTPTTQTFSLPAGAAFWKVIGGGFKYKDSDGVNGPVKTLIIKKSGGGTFLLKATGKAAVQPINLVPPNTGTSADVSLSIGNTKYCTSFGGAAGGELDPNDEKTFKAKNATAEVACPP